MAQTPKHLIVIPGHAAFKDTVGELPSKLASDEFWCLQSFQAGEPKFYLQHIAKGLALLKKDPHALLLVSGGRTRKDTRKWSEASTYMAIAQKLIHNDPRFKQDADLINRLNTESFARDSFENLQYSIYRYYYLTGSYPQHTTVVGWKFKADRFDFHRQTLGIPKDAFTYLGCNNPSSVKPALEGEIKTIEMFRSDPWGLAGQLTAKRRERNPFKDRCTYSRCPHLAHSPAPPVK